MKIVIGVLGTSLCLYLCHSIKHGYSAESREITSTTLVIEHEEFSDGKNSHEKNNLENLGCQRSIYRPLYSISDSKIINLHKYYLDVQEVCEQTLQFDDPRYLGEHQANLETLTNQINDVLITDNWEYFIDGVLLGSIQTDFLAKYDANIFDVLVTFEAPTSVFETLSNNGFKPSASTYEYFTKILILVSEVYIGWRILVSQQI